MDTLQLQTSDPESVLSKQKSVFFDAVKGGHVEKVEELLRQGLDVNVTDAEKASLLM